MGTIKKEPCDYYSFIKTNNILCGDKRTYLKFVRLEDKDCKDILEYLKQFAYSDMDATPSVTPFMKAEMEYYN